MKKYEIQNKRIFLRVAELYAIPIHRYNNAYFAILFINISVGFNISYLVCHYFPNIDYDINYVFPTSFST